MQVMIYLFVLISLAVMFFINRLVYKMSEKWSQFPRAQDDVFKKIFSIFSGIKQRKASNPHIWEAQTN